MTEHTPHVDNEPDAWHLHTAEEGQAQEAHAAKANPVILVGAWAAITFSVIAVVVVVVIFFDFTSTEVRRQRVETTALATEHHAYRDQSKAAMEQTAWIDSQDGIVQIPLDQAMQQVIEQYREGE